MIKPTEDRVLIEPVAVETKTASGLYIPESAQEKPNKGTVIASGIGKYASDTGVLIPMQVKVGDVVVYYMRGSTEVSDNGKNYLIMKESDIYAVL